MLPQRVLAWPIALRPIAADDAPRVQLLAGERSVAETTALIPHPYPDGAAEAWIATQAGDWSTGREYTYAIEVESVLVGVVSLRPVAGKQENLGFWIGRPYWGSGYATAAASAVIALAFSCLELDVVTASHLSRNVASARVLEKCGMSLLRTGTRDHRRALEAFCVRGISREEWEARLAG